MTAIGLMEAVGLWLLGVPLAGTLGFIAALLTVHFQYWTVRCGIARSPDGLCYHPDNGIALHRVILPRPLHRREFY
jgi:hypothetical protein